MNVKMREPLHSVSTRSLARTRSKSSQLLTGIDHDATEEEVDRKAPGLVEASGEQQEGFEQQGCFQGRQG